MGKHTTDKGQQSTSETNSGKRDSRNHKGSHREGTALGTTAQRKQYIDKVMGNK